jgi:D-glycero-alpha-D-manno-heptose 1-phosphate guanylyltransferase
MTIPNEAIILAGGMGTRLKQAVPDIPKPMAPIAGKPFLEYLLDYIARYDITSVILSVGYRWEVIRTYFGEQYKSMNLSYAIENHPLGTGGGIRLAMQGIAGDSAYLFNGDTFFNVDLNELGRFYKDHDAAIAMTAKQKKDVFRYGTLRLEGTCVRAFIEKGPVRSGLINGGTYLINRSVFDRFSLQEKFSFEDDLLTKHLSEISVHAMISNGYFIDIGVPEDYEKAQQELPDMLTH